MMLSTESEHRELTNREIILFEDFQPMWSRYLNVTNGRRDIHTCRRHTVPILRSAYRRSSTHSEWL